MSDRDEDDGQSKVHLSRDDYLIIVSWMENPKNIAKIHGSQKKTTVGAKTKKPDAFGQLAAHLHAHTKNPKLQSLSSTNMSRRWTTYKRRFTKALAAKRSETGMGLTPAEIKKGLSIPGKLDKMCPHFARMEALLVEKHNISAAGTTELGAVARDPTETSPTSDASSDTDGDEGDENANEVTVEREVTGEREVAGGEEVADGEEGAPEREVCGDDGVGDVGYEVLVNEEPEFRFDLASPAPAETGHSDSGADKAVENELGLSDDDLFDLNSRFLESYDNAEPNTRSAGSSSSNESEATSLGTTSSRTTSSRNPSSSARNSSKTAKKSSSKKKPRSKKTHKRDLRPESLAEDRENAGGNKNGNSQQQPKDTKVSISMAYAENTKQRNELFKRRLDQTDTKEKHNQLRWMQEQRAAKREQESRRRHELLMVLVNQGKTPQEVEEYLRVASLAALNGASSSSRVHVAPARNTAVDIDCVGAAVNGLRRDDSDNTRPNEEVWNV